MSADELQKWAEAIESRDDVSFHSVQAIIGELASPQEFGQITEAKVRDLRKSVGIEDTGEALTVVEKALLTAFVSGDHPVLELLQRQAEVTTVTDRAWSDVGCTSALLVAPGHDPISPSGFALDDVAFTLTECADPGHAVLWIRDGLLSDIMYCNWTDTWPDRAMLEAISYLWEDGKEHSGRSSSRDMDAVSARLAA